MDFFGKRKRWLRNTHTIQNDGFTVRVARDVGEAATLIEAGFECATGEYNDGGKLFKRRKIKIQRVQ
jgi:hypothetical protein